MIFSTPFALNRAALALALVCGLAGCGGSDSPATAPETTQPTTPQPPGSGEQVSLRCAP